MWGGGGGALKARSFGDLPRRDDPQALPHRGAVAVLIDHTRRACRGPLRHPHQHTVASRGSWLSRDPIGAATEADLDDVAQPAAGDPHQRVRSRGLLSRAPLDAPQIGGPRGGSGCARDGGQPAATHRERGDCEGEAKAIEVSAASGDAVRTAAQLQESHFLRCRVTAFMK